MQQIQESYEGDGCALINITVSEVLHIAFEWVNKQIGFCNFALFFVFSFFLNCELVSFGANENPLQLLQGGDT